MATLSVYLRDEDKLIVERARKLLNFHEDKSLSNAFIEYCSNIMIKYGETPHKEGMVK